MNEMPLVVYLGLYPSNQFFSIIFEEYNQKIKVSKKYPEVKKLPYIIVIFLKLNLKNSNSFEIY